jgi:hypothetical protein
VLFHVTIGHKSSDCPGRRPTDPPALVAPSDTRENLGHELNVKLHFVLWGAACMLWAQPEHLAFAVLEAEDVESALQYVTALVPEDWTASVLPVWNLPSQLRLIRQVRLATPTHFGEGLPPAESGAKAAPSRAEPAARRRVAAAEAAELEVAEAKADEPPPPEPRALEEVNTRPPEPARTPEPESPGTITRILRDLDSAASGPSAAPSSSAKPAAEVDTARHQAPSTQIIEPRKRESSATPTAWLVASAGPAKGKTFNVVSDGATIGRLPEHEVYIPDERLSREHARIDFREGRYWLQDLGSMNGTALNGTLVADPQSLQSGDTIELGSSKLVVTVNPGRAS